MNKRTYFLALVVGSISLTAVKIHAQAATIYMDSELQVISGFGAASPWYLPVATESEIESAFGSTDGQIGLSIYRITVEADSNLWAKWVPSTLQAQNLGAIIIASPWYAPGTLSEFRDGETRIQLDKYDEYIDHLNAFVTFMQNNGVNIYGLSVQNEPDIGDWTNWSPTEMFTLMRDYAHAIQGTQVMAPESYHFDRAYADPILNDSTAAANTDIVCGHIYGGGLTKYQLAEDKGKEVWMTEYLFGENNSGNNMGWAMHLAKNISDVMNADMSAYVWWTMIRYYGPIGDGTTAANPADPYESYPAKGEVTKKGYVLSQFSRFIRPGFVRVAATYYPRAQVYVTAYKSDSDIVIVAVNQGLTSVSQTFSIPHLAGGVAAFTPYVTSETANCQPGGMIGLVDGTFTAVLESESITTFVATDYVSGTIDAGAVPQSITLSQNYPNPFNPETHISYTISQSDFVTLRIYDILGRDIYTLTNEYQPAGNYTVTVNADQLSSGIYFYKLQTGSAHSETRKMLLLR